MPLELKAEMEEFLSGHFIGTDVLHIFVSTAEDSTGLDSATSCAATTSGQQSRAEKTLPVRKSQSCNSCSQHMVLRGSVETSKTPAFFMKLLSEDLGKAVQER